jgi:tetratricopeptide (TPR) repeat protein
MHLQVNCVVGSPSDLAAVRSGMKPPRPRWGRSSSISLGLALSLIASECLASGRAEPSEKFGGVEIGAKGVKASAVQVDRGGAKPVLKVLELDKKTIDVTISRLKGKKFDAALIDDTAEVVKGFIAALESELGVPESNTKVVASSGVPFANNFADLVTAVRERTGKGVEKIDAREEATLTAIALVPEHLRTAALIVDVGSGNTKGGAFLDKSGSPESFATLEVPFGTTTLTKEIDSKAAGSATPRPEVAREVGSQLIGESLRQQVAEKPEFAQRDLVLFAGGSVWAFVTIMKPETALEPFAKIAAADVKAYRNLLSKTPGSYPEVDFSRVGNPDARKVAEADYARIRGAKGDSPVFKPAELESGAILLEEIADKLAFAKRTVLFDRKAVTAWITTYITPADVRQFLPQALGRKLTFVPQVRTTEEIQPESARPRRVDEAVAMKAYSAGYDLYCSGQPQEALTAFQKAIEFSDGDARIMYFKGLTELALGDEAAAQSSIGQAARLENRSMPDTHTVGLALVRIQGPVRRYIEQIRDRVQEIDARNRDR